VLEPSILMVPERSELPLVLLSLLPQAAAPRDRAAHAGATMNNLREITDLLLG
jgi:hypothetical protein